MTSLLGCRRRALERLDRAEIDYAKARAVISRAIATMHGQTGPDRRCDT